jgi:salicylate hydroxylase
MNPTRDVNGSKAAVNIAIVGGGFTGLSLAIGLHRYQIPFQIYEASPTFSELGAGITVAPNGVNAMAKIHPTIQKEFLKHATSNGQGSQRDVFLTCRDGRTDDAPLLYPNEGHPYRSIHRATFLSILAGLLPPDAIHFNKRLEDVAAKDGAVELFFADGTRATASAVCGCDGVRSHVRSLMAPREPAYSGIYSYRGLTKMDRAIETIGEPLAMTAQNYVGVGGHVITYPINGGTILNIVGCKYDPGAMWSHDRWQVPSTRERMMKDFDHMGAAARRVLSLVETYDHWASFDLPTPLLPFYNGCIVLVGDAAHCTTPHIGAGVSLALEDAYVLAELMHEMNDASEIHAVFQAFDTCRRPRTEKVVTASREAAAIYQFRKPNARDIATELRGRHDWIWELDLDRHVSEARSAFQSCLHSGLGSSGVHSEGIYT